MPVCPVCKEQVSSFLWQKTKINSSTTDYAALDAIEVYCPKCQATISVLGDVDEQNKLMALLFNRLKNS